MIYAPIMNTQNRQIISDIIYLLCIKAFFYEQVSIVCLSAAPQPRLTQLFSYFIIPASDTKPPTKDCTNTNSAQNKLGVCIFFLRGAQKDLNTLYHNCKSSPLSINPPRLSAVGCGVNLRALLVLSLVCVFFNFTGACVS